MCLKVTCVSPKLPQHCIYLSVKSLLRLAISQYIFEHQMISQLGAFSMYPAALKHLSMAADDIVVGMQ